MPLRIVQVDAFTAHPFAGNPAAVCVLPEPRPAAWMQDVAREMNLAETAFLERRADGWGLRWFTPSVEVDLCGHATLASAHALWESGALAPGEEARFHTRSGVLTAERRGAWIEMDFPVKPVTEAPAPEGLLAALGGPAPRWTGLAARDAFLELASEAELRALAPDFKALRAVDTRAVIVTARAASPEHDVVSRFFAPGEGIDEDPVTGSAHCALAAYWAPRLGKPDFLGYQASPRGGTVRVGLRGERVKLGGQAITVMTGELLV